MDDAPDEQRSRTEAALRARHRLFLLGEGD